MTAPVFTSTEDNHWLNPMSLMMAYLPLGDLMTFIGKLPTCVLVPTGVIFFPVTNCCGCAVELAVSNARQTTDMLIWQRRPQGRKRRLTALHIVAPLHSLVGCWFEGN